MAGKWPSTAARTATYSPRPGVQASAFSLSSSQYSRQRPNPGRGSASDVAAREIAKAFNFRHQGAQKISSGAALILGGTAADATGLGALVGVPAGGWGALQVFLGVFKGWRGINQMDGAIYNPVEKSTPLRYGEDILLGILPNFSSAENFIGGLG